MQALNLTRRLTSLILIITVTFIFSTAIGGNGCLWVAHSGDSSVGSSGANQATSPNPANGATNVSVTQTLSWLSVYGMTSYDVYLGTTNPPTYLTNVPNEVYRTSYQPGQVLQGSTTYYWRIDSKNSAGTYIGYIWQFQAAAQALVITGANPPTGSTNVAITPTLTWNAVSGAASYDIYFGLTNPPSFITSTVSASYTSGSLSYNTLYYWKISARDSLNGILATSGIWNFQTMVVLTPAAAPNPPDNGTDAAISIILSWASDTAATNYDIYFGTANPPSFAGNTTKAVYRTTYNPGTLTYGTQYYWRVNTKDNSGGQVIGAVWTFTTVPPIPDAASSPNPSPGAINVPVNQVLTWTPAARAASYEIYFGTTLTPSYRTLTTLTSYNPGTLAYNSTYYWQVNSKNTTGRAIGAIWNFSTAMQALAVKAAGPNPTNNMVDCSQTSQLSWLSGADAISYDVYFSADVQPLFQTNVPKAVYRTVYNPGTLQFSTTYYWRVDARNTGGATAGDVWTFTTMPARPGQAGGENPSSGTMDTAKNLTLSWGAAVRADSYDVYFSTTSTIILGDKKINTTGFVYTPTGLAYNRTYYWRVDARNINGVTTGSVWNFTTLRPPAKAIIISPADGSFDVGIHQPMLWGGALRADSYNIYIDTVNPPVWLISNTSNTTFVPTLAVSTTYSWRIDAMNLAGTTAGDVQTFVTLAPPQQAVNVSPLNGAVEVTADTVLNWNAALGTDYYNIYFGTATTPTFAVSSTGLSYAPDMAPGVRYYWRIDAANDSGATAGVTWHFDTLDIASVSVSGDDNITAGVSSTAYTALSYSSTGTLVADTCIWSVVSGSGTASLNGNVLTGIQAGTVTIRATSVKEPTVFGAKVVTVIPGAIVLVTVSGDTTITSGVESNGYAALSKDAAGNIVADTYTWSLTTGTGTANITNFNHLTGVLAGTVTMVGTSVTKPTVSGNFGVTVIPGTIASVTVLGDTTIASGAESTGYMAVSKDAAGNTVADTYTWSLTTSTGTANITNTNHLTGISIGTVTMVGTSVTKPTVSGNIGVTVMSGIISSVVVFGDSTITSGAESTGYTAVSKDAAGNAVADTYTWNVTTGTGTANITNTNHLTGAIAGTVTMIGTSVNNPAAFGSQTVTVVFGAPAKLAFTIQPETNTNVTVGTGFSSPLQVTALDTNGNTVTSFISNITISGNGAGLNGQLTQAAVSGVATFSGVTVQTAPASGCSVSAASGSLVPDTSNNFNIVPGSAVNLVWVSQPITYSNIVVGTAFASSLQVAAKDIYGNIADSFVGNVTVNGNGTILNGTLIQPAIAGIATFPGATVGTVPAAGCTVSMSSSLSTITSNAFNVVHGAAQNLTFIQQPTDTKVLTTITPTITVNVKDVYGNNVPSVSVALTTTNGALMNGTLAQLSDANGIAAFGDLSLGIPAQHYALSASASGCATIASGLFNISGFNNSGGGNWSYSRPITFTNNSGSALADYQVLVEPFRDSDFAGRYSYPAVPTPPTPPTPPETVFPVGYWAFNEGSGSTVSDASGYNNSGTLVNNPLWVTGKVGSYALSFNGTNNYVSIPHNDLYCPVSKTITLEAWVKLNDTNAVGEIVSKYINGTSPNNWQGYCLCVNFGGAGTLGVWVGDTTNGWATINGITWDTTNWHHVAMTYDGTNIKFYVDGILKGTIARPAGNIVSNAPVIIASWPGVGGRFLNACIDEPKIYNSVLTDAQISVHAGLTPTGMPPLPAITSKAPIGQWSLSEGIGTTTADSSVNGNNGTLMASPAWVMGRYGNALQFNSASKQYVSIPHSAILEPVSKTLTVECWVKRNDISGQAEIVEKYSASNPWGGYALASDTTSLRMWVGDLPNASSWSYATVPWDTTNWHHIVGSWNGTTVKLYFDGNPLAVTNSNTPAGNINSGSPLCIGAQPDPAVNRYFNGLVDEVKIYDYEMSSAEVALHYGSGLIGSWHFSEALTDTSTATTDMSGRFNHGTLVNSPIRVAGRFGNALQFDGTSSYVQVPNMDTNILTFSGWVKRARTGATSNECIIGAVNANGWEVGFASAGVNADKLFLAKTGGTAVYSTGVVTDTNWHYLAVTYDGTTAKFYIDGFTDSTPSFVQTFSSGNNYTIGSRGTGEYFQGVIDEVRVYKRTLSGNEIYYQYNSGTPKAKPDFSDIRFANTGLTEEYSYWQETDARFWVKLPSLVTGNTVFNMWYGNISATATSDINKPFIFADDFTGTSLGASWNTTGTSGPGSVTLSNGTVTLSTGDGTGNAFLTRNLNVSDLPCRIETGARLYYNTGGQPKHIFGTPGKTTHGVWGNTTNDQRVYWNSLAVNPVINIPTTFIKLSQIYQSTQVDWQIYNSDAAKLYANSYSSTNPTEQKYSTVASGSAGCGITIDWTFVRKYAAVEPTHTTPGAEQ